MGFHEFQNWEAQIIKTVIESFFVAIHQGKLIARVGRTTLNKTSLPDQIKKHYAVSGRTETTPLNTLLLR
ncbi:hypothetical protein [Tunturiibacter lichenicola]|jgi:hypothetical protein|uniref:hypothetical protein n=1 Tax=Tunturiibacter lichenicola TaxID=2051959 RepID=UPI003D9B8EC2